MALGAGVTYGERHTLHAPLPSAVVIAIVSLVRASATMRRRHARWMSRVAPLHAHGEMSGLATLVRTAASGPAPLARHTKHARPRAGSPVPSRRAVRAWSPPTSLYSAGPGERAALAASHWSLPAAPRENERPADIALGWLARRAAPSS